MEKKVTQLFESRQSQVRTGDLLVGKQRSCNCANHARQFNVLEDLQLITRIKFAFVDIIDRPVVPVLFQMLFLLENLLQGVK